MPTPRVFMASLFVAFVVIPLLVDRGATTQRVVTGTVAEFHTGEWMLVTNEQTSLPVALVEMTAYEGNADVIKPGVRVTVWYRSVAERRPVADKVRVLPDRAIP